MKDFKDTEFNIRSWCHDILMWAVVKKDRLRADSWPAYVQYMILFSESNCPFHFFKNINMIHISAYNTHQNLCYMLNNTWGKKRILETGHALESCGTWSNCFSSNWKLQQWGIFQPLTSLKMSQWVLMMQPQIRCSCAFLSLSDGIKPFYNTIQPTGENPFGAFHTIFRNVGPKIPCLKYFLLQTQRFLAERQGDYQLWHKTEIKWFINYYYSAPRIEWALQFQLENQALFIYYKHKRKI